MPMTLTHTEFFKILECDPDKSSAGSASINRWTKYGKDRLYIEGWKNKIYIDLKHETVEADEGRVTPSMEIDREAGRIHLVRDYGTGSDLSMTIALDPDPEHCNVDARGSVMCIPQQDGALNIVADPHDHFQRVLSKRADFEGGGVWRCPEEEREAVIRNAKACFEAVHIYCTTPYIKEDLLQEGVTLIDDATGDAYEVVEVELDPPFPEVSYVRFENDDGETETIEVGEFGRTWKFDDPNDAF